MLAILRLIQVLFLLLMEDLLVLLLLDWETEAKLLLMPVIWFSLGDEAGNGRLLTNIESGAIGNSGGVEINTANLSVTNGAQISSSTFGLGDGGAILINASESVVLEGRR